MTLLDRVCGFLARHDMPHALIGALALAAHGVSRSTMDQDLLVMDRRVLDSGFWSSLPGPAAADPRRGSADDPLAGVVRIREPDERDVDVVVGRHAWQHGVLQRAARMGDQPLCIVEAADLILLKLYAGGSQDRWDIEQLVALDGTGALADVVESRLGDLPPRSRALWTSLHAKPG